MTASKVWGTTQGLGSQIVNTNIWRFLHECIGLRHRTRPAIDRVAIPVIMTFDHPGTAAPEHRLAQGSSSRTANQLLHAFEDCEV